MLKSLLFGIAVLSTCSAANAYVCLATMSPAEWAKSTGQRPVATMEIMLGDGTTAPGVVMVDKDESFVIFFREAQTGRTCVMLMGKKITVLPPGTPT